MIGKPPGTALRSPLGRVLGRGAAGGGAHHWRIQRLTAIALVPLTLWFVFSVAGLPGLTYDAVTHWIGRGFTPVLLALLVVALAWHSALGVQVVIEDYVHGRVVKPVALTLASFAHVLVAAAALVAVLRIAARSVT